MDRPAASTQADEARVSTPRVRVRYWAAAKAAAGVAEEVIAGHTVADVIAAATDLHRGEPRFEKVISVCSFLLDEAPIGARDWASVDVADGDVLDVLPPFAGGSSTAAAVRLGRWGACSDGI